MDEVFLQGTCLVCQAKIADQYAKAKHIAEKSHIDKLAVYSFTKSDIPQMEKSYDGTSAFYSLSSKRSCSVLGLECIYEINFPWTKTTPIWICTMCFAAGDNPESFCCHVDSDLHREIYLNDYGEDSGLTMPELYNGTAPKSIVYEKLKIGLPETQNSVVKSIAKSEESESVSTGRRANAVKNAVKNTDETNEKVSEAISQTAVIEGHFSLQRGGHSSSVNKTVSIKRATTKSIGNFNPSNKQASQKRAAVSEGSSSVQCKKTRLSIEHPEVIPVDSVLLIDVSDEEIQKQKPNLKQEVAKVEKKTRSETKNLNPATKALPDNKHESGAKLPTTPPPTIYRTLPIRTCINSTRQSSNVLVLTPRKVDPLSKIMALSAGNRKTAAVTEKTSHPGDTKSYSEHTPKSAAKEKMPLKPSSTVTSEKEEKQKSVQYTSTAKQSDRSSSHQESTKAVGSRRRSRTRSPGYVRPYRSDSARPRASHHGGDSHRTISSREHRRSRSKSPSDRNSIPPTPVDEARVQELKTRMYAHRRQLMQLQHRRDLVDYLWKQGIEPIRPDDSKAILFNSAAAAIPDIVGVTNLYPVECYDRPGFDSLYCGMCSFWSTCSVIIEKHLVSYIHRMNYLSRNFPTFYKIVKDEHDKAMKEKLLEQYVKQIWRTEGSGMMTHRLKCVISGAALEKLWPENSKFKSDRWKSGVKVEIIHQAAQQEAYERLQERERQNEFVHEKGRERRRTKSRSRSRSKHRDRSHRISLERRMEDRGRDHDHHRREHDKAREQAHERRRSRSRSPHRSSSRSASTRDLNRSSNNQYDRSSRDRHELFGVRPARVNPLSEEDKQLQVICRQLGLSERDLPKARLIVSECSKHLGFRGSPGPDSNASQHRPLSPTSERLSSLRKILDQVLAMETQRHELSHSPQPHPSQQFNHNIHELLPSLQQQQHHLPLQQLPSLMQQQIPPPDLWQSPSVASSWTIPPPNLSVPPPAPVPPPFPVPQAQHNLVYGQPTLDSYGYQPSSGHHY